VATLVVSEWVITGGCALCLLLVRGTVIAEVNCMPGLVSTQLTVVPLFAGRNTPTLEGHAR